MIILIVVFLFNNLPWAGYAQGRVDVWVDELLLL
jgi:hypothetical protein